MFYKEIKVLSQNADGVIYVENENGIVFGIVSSTKITDEDGLPFQDDALSIIESNFECDIEQDWENGTTTIYTDCKGRIVFDGPDVKLIG